MYRYSLPILLLLSKAAHNDNLFILGPTGAKGKLAGAGVQTMTVNSIVPGSPANGKLFFGDKSISANNVALSEGRFQKNSPVTDLRVPLRNAITTAEATDGKLLLGVGRSSGESAVAPPPSPAQNRLENQG